MVGGGVVTDADLCSASKRKGKGRDLGGGGLVVEV
jgi:hypothetical protein